MKRHNTVISTSHSGECSDIDDFYDDSVDMLKDGSPSQSCHRSDRKRRRGVIEKRRRDRINNSLSELRRLVPAAFEKQDSAKLEKAEILQMTVDHLKTLHAKAAAASSGPAYNIDTTALALDCRIVGFRECTAEVARYLVSVEGLDCQDPLRLRLIGHLQSLSAQRETKSTGSSQLHHGAGGGHQPPPAWSSSPHQHQHQHFGQPPSSSHHQQLLNDSTSAVYLDASRGHHIGGDGSGMRLMTSSHSVSGSSAPGGTPSGHQFVGSHHHPSLLAGLQPIHHSPAQFLQGASGGGGCPPLPMLSPNSLHYGPSTASMLAQGVKPYRPWGAELAY